MAQVAGAGAGGAGAATGDSQHTSTSAAPQVVLAHTPALFALPRTLPARRHNASFIVAQAAGGGGGGGSGGTDAREGEREGGRAVGREDRRAGADGLARAGGETVGPAPSAVKPSSSATATSSSPRKEKHCESGARRVSVLGGCFRKVASDLPRRDTSSHWGRAARAPSTATEKEGGTAVMLSDLHYVALLERTDQRRGARRAGTATPRSAL